jgi:hypothetical protein
MCMLFGMQPMDVVYASLNKDITFLHNTEVPWLVDREIVCFIMRGWHT